MHGVRLRFILPLLFVLISSLYALTFSFRGVTDTALNSLQTRSLVRHGDIDLARYPRPRGNTVVRDGHRYSVYGAGISLAAAPVYGVLVPAGASDTLLQGTVAILYATAAVVTLFVVLVRLFPPALAAAGTAVLGFGTTLWPVGSMALYQHAPVLFLEGIGLAGLFSRRRHAPIVAGAGFGAAALVRPTAAIPLVVVGIGYLIEDRRSFLRYALAALAPVVGLFIETRWIWGSWFTSGYAIKGQGFHANVPRTLDALLFGWWRGLFVYSPVLVLGLVGCGIAVRRARGFVERRVIALGVATLATFLAYSRWDQWWGGLNQFGYRLLLDVAPFLVIAGAYAVDRWRRVAVPAAALGVVSILTMTFGAAPSRFGFDGVMFARSPGEASLGQAWIVFGHSPGPALVRLAGVAAVAAAMFWGAWVGKRATTARVDPHPVA